MFKDYWKMSDKELEQLARKYNLRGFLEETVVLTNDRKVGTDFIINRRDVVEQLSQRDNRNIAFGSAIVAVLSAAISLFANFYLFTTPNQSIYRMIDKARLGIDEENIITRHKCERPVWKNFPFQNKWLNRHESFCQKFKY